MKTLCRTLTSIALLVVLASTADAAELFSAALNHGPGLQYTCRVVNISGRTRDVTIEIIDLEGITRGGPSTFSLGPGQGHALVLDSVIVNQAYCKATVEGGKDNFRGMFSLENNSGDPVTVVTTPLD